MSGIAGIWALDGRPVDPTSLEKMMQCIRYRGPDGSGTWVHGSVGLGHQQLCTTRESLHEKQPLQSQDGTLCLTADARVDNRDELKANLEAHGVKPRTDTDAELILGAYQVWGEDCPHHVLGDFAFALWDGRRRQLFFAGDPVGAKPLYYHHDARTFRFASIPSALFADGQLSRKPNIGLMMVHLFDGNSPNKNLYKDVYQLPPGQRLVLNEAGLRTSRYWDPDPHRLIRYKTNEEYAEHFLHLFRDAVRVRLRSHGPVGATLSGGLDSSSIVCVAQVVMQAECSSTSGFETYSQIFEGQPCDERNYIEEVLRRWDLQGHLFPFEEIRSWLDFERLGSLLDVPYFPTLSLIAPLLQMAQARGVRTMLSGVGGDDLLDHGRGHLTDLWRQGRLWRLLGQLRLDAADLKSSAAWLFVQHCLRPSVPKGIRSAVRRLTGRRLPSWINAATVQREAAVLEMLRPPASKLRFPNPSQQTIYDRLLNGWTTNVALADIENLAAHFCMEFRYPFFDRRMIEFLLAMPWQQRFQEGRSKWVLRAATRCILPEMIRKRKDKPNFTGILVGEFFSRQASKVRGLLQFSVLDTLGLIHANHFLELFDARCNNDFRGITARICRNVIWLELWCRSALLMQPTGVPNERLQAQ